jgi:hypothetical protein
MVRHDRENRRCTPLGGFEVERSVISADSRRSNHEQDCGRAKIFDNEGALGDWVRLLTLWTRRNLSPFSL